jgi:hypothetical protein
MADMEDIEVALDRVNETLRNGFAQLHQDLEKVQRLIRENTEAVHERSE